MMNRKVLIALLFAVALPVSANQLAVDRGSFELQREAIEEKLADGKTYAEINAADRSDVRDALERMSAMIERAGSVDQLSETEKAAVFNQQERVNTILMRASADSQMVCEHSPKTGTRFKTTQCSTVAERRRRREIDQHELLKVQRPIMPVRL